MQKQDILSMTIEQLEEALIESGEQKFRAKQVFSWLHERRAKTFFEMDNLPKSLREKLSQNFSLFLPKIVEIKISDKDNTRKYLLELENDTIIECVLMDYDYGLSVCISSQAGCKMGCSFCASAPNGFHRSLTAGEMLSQVYAVEADAERKAGRVVIMGTGEPFDNFDNVVKFIELINSKNGHNMGARSITVSTCGIVPEILRFADTCPQVNLAVSLHAPCDEIRRQLMPIAKRYPFGELMDACVTYTKKTNRRITFEYILIDGVNDGAEHARQLARALKSCGLLLCHVNLIRANEVDGLNATTSSKSADAFLKALLREKVNATMRRSLGGDIGGACGQLRNHHDKGK